jgi:hypothetical protein
MPLSDRQRIAMLSLARQIASSGAHYLTGTFGARPLEADTISGRLLEFRNDTTWEQLAVHAAEWSGMRCCGRYAVVAGSVAAGKLRYPQHLPPSGDLAVWLRAIQGGTQWGHIDMSGQQGAPRFVMTRNVRAFRDRFWPRRYVVDNRGRLRDPDLCHPEFVYLGEDCTGKMHFDCVGFVCYLLTQVTGRTVRRGLPDDGVGSWGSKIDDYRLVQPGDAMMSASHIAVVEESQGGTIWIIHANGDSRGVERTRFNRGADTWSRNFQAVQLA